MIYENHIPKNTQIQLAQDTQIFQHIAKFYYGSYSIFNHRTVHICCYINLFLMCSDHFCQNLRVATEVGLYHPHYLMRASVLVSGDIGKINYFLQKDLRPALLH